MYNKNIFQNEDNGIYLVSYFLEVWSSLNNLTL
jgi:hypothetical protein